MKITDLLTKETIILDLQSATKMEVLNELIETLARAGSFTIKKRLRRPSLLVNLKVRLELAKG